MERISLQKLFGKKVFIKLTKEASQNYKNWDIGHRELVAFISGIEETLGIWVWHPTFKIKFKRDKDGIEIPEKQRIAEEVETDFFIPWKYIEGIANLHDERLTCDEPEKRIGFIYPEKKKEI